MEADKEKQIDDAVKSIFSPEMMDLLSDAVRNEKAIVRYATKAINEAIASGCRDLDYMDQVPFRSSMRFFLPLSANFANFAVL